MMLTSMLIKLTNLTKEENGCGKQGLALVDFSAQREPFLTQNTPYIPPNTLNHPLNTLEKTHTSTPYRTQSAYAEPKSGRV